MLFGGEGAINFFYPNKGTKHRMTYTGAGEVFCDNELMLSGLDLKLEELNDKLVEEWFDLALFN
jgi:hypothetical protein